MTNCSLCSTGQYQSSTGQSACTDCSRGTYTSEKGETSCTRCDSTYGTGYDSKVGKSTCSICQSDYYLEYSDVTSATSTTCVACPGNGNCQSVSGSKIVSPKKEYWIDISNSKYFISNTLTVYSCPRANNCKGSVKYCVHTLYLFYYFSLCLSNKCCICSCTFFPLFLYFTFTFPPTLPFFFQNKRC